MANSSSDDGDRGKGQANPPASKTRSEMEGRNSTKFNHFIENLIWTPDHALFLSLSLSLSSNYLDTIFVWNICQNKYWPFN